MAVTNGWGQGVINNTNGWGKLATNTIGAGSVYENSASGDTALIGTSAAFSYSASSFTQADADPTPTITGTTGGTFSGTSGLVFISTSTGQIDLSASTIAAHVVTYTVGGVSSNFNLSVTAAPFSNTLSYNFDGVDDFIEANLDGTASGGILAASDSDINLSVSFWFASQGNNNNKGIISWGNHIPDGFPAFFTVQQIFQSGQRKIQVQADGASYRGTVDISNTDGVWHHVLITRTSSDNTWRGFLNGSSSAWFTHDDGGSITYRNFAEKLYIGAGYVPYYSGNIDEVSVFNSVQNAATIYGTGVPNDISSLNPVAWYRMGENSNYKSPQWLMPENSNFSNSRFSNFSLEFDGVDDFIELSSGMSTSGTNWSISCWFKTSQSGGNRILVGQTGSKYFGINFGKLTFISSDNSFDTISSFNVNDGNWHNAIFTYNYTTGAWKNYIDGVIEDDQTATTGVNIPGWKFFGARSSTQFRANCNLDEIAYFETELSASDVNSIYNSGIPTDLSSYSPKGWWRMGEEATFSTNWTIPDQVGSNDGTSSNMTIEDKVGNAPNSDNNAVSFNMTESDRETDVPS